MRLLLIPITIAYLLNIMALTQDHLEKAVAIARRYGADRVLLFGSALHDLESARDLDLAIGGVDGWAFFGMAAEMERVVPVPIDVISLDPETRFNRHIMKRGRFLYEHR